MARKLLAAALACAALAAPAAARAADVTDDPLTKASLGIAERHWGRAPERCGGSVSVWLYSEAEPNVFARANGTDCVIWVSTESGFRLRGTDPVLYCDVIAHEWGHLLGYGHSADPSDLMFPIVPRAVPECAAPTYWDVKPRAARPRRRARAAHAPRPRRATRPPRSARR